eukprot:TRINITY_DN10446_c0_g2_i2.p3 TRINITY_DN10446_c0_g2~~TRINITY_DN10446_c0_g2_i2.p3  ORF type:complete len:116 (+),score=0.55 TRINITY_DN10446_c0_g2_i2:248-595(+)
MSWITLNTKFKSYVGEQPPFFFVQSLITNIVQNRFFFMYHENIHNLSSVRVFHLSEMHAYKNPLKFGQVYGSTSRLPQNIRIQIDEAYDQLTVRPVENFDQSKSGHLIRYHSLRG